VADVASLEAALERRTRRLGGHYTPMPIARRAVAAALGPLCRERGREGVLRLRILDPAVGSGRFLLAALDLLAEATGHPDRHRAALAHHCLFGIDVCAEAAALARQRIADAAGIAPAALERHIVAADSLLADLPATLGVGAFDAVVTNPPWLSHSGRQAAALAPRRRRALARRFAAFRRWPTTHGAFLELAARLLAPGGRAALILPHQVCHLPGYEAARRAARARCRLEPPPEPLGEHCFPGVTQPAAIVFLHRPVAVLPQGCRAQARPGVRAPAAGLDRVAARILAKLERHPPAPREAFGDIGVHSGNSARLIVHAEPGPGRAPVREGRCIRAFALDPARKWLDIEPDLPDGRYCTIRPLATYRRARILIRQTADRPVAARHAQPTYFRNSALACYGVEGLDDAVLLGLLNSSPLAWWHRARHADSRQRAFPQVKVAHLRALPLARDAAAIAPVVRRLEALAAQGAHDALARERRRLDQRVARLYGLTEAEQQLTIKGVLRCRG